MTICVLPSLNSISFSMMLSFDRKSYFYPDSPSAYQITQLYTPVVEHGKLRIDFEDGKHKEAWKGLFRKYSKAGPAAL